MLMALTFAMMITYASLASTGRVEILVTGCQRKDFSRGKRSLKKSISTHLLLLSKLCYLSYYKRALCS